MARTDRERFLVTVRAALARGGGGHEEPVPLPGLHAPAETDLASHFAREAEAADCGVTRTTSLDEAREAIRLLLARRGARRIVRGDTPLLRELELDGELDVTVCSLALSARDELRAAATEADAGLTEADFGIAESGTLALLHRPGQGRAVSLLPPLHVALLRASRIVPELGSLFATLEADERHPAGALTFVTGPSRTGDIEFVLTRGVHGPEEVYVVLLDDA